MTVSEALDTQSALIASHRGRLQGALNQVTTFFDGDLAYQWRLTNQIFMPPPNHTIAASDPYEVVIPVFQLPKWFRLPTDWQPVIGQPAPSLNSDRSAIVQGFVREPYPIAEQAKNHYKANMPTLSGVPQGQDRDVEELIAFPRALGVFYDNWDQVKGKLAGMPTRIEDAANVDLRVSYDGIGAKAYKLTRDKQSQAATATAKAILRLRENVLVLAEAGVDLCELLVGICQKNADDLQSWASTVVNLTDPKQWRPIVQEAIDQIGRNNKAQNEAFVQGLKSLQEDAARSFTLDTFLGDLGDMLGTEVDGIGWPKPHDQLDEPW